MPSPDVRRFVDLTLYDLESQSIFLNAINYARTALPEFQPREGSIETVMLQAMAVEVAELVRSINRLPSGIVQVLLRLLDIQRSDGLLPTATVQLSGANNTEYELPAGIRVFYQSGLDADPLLLVTDGTVRLTHAKTVSSVVVDSNVASVITSAPHGFTSAQTITFAGFTSPHTDLNASRTITVTGDTAFTFAVTKANATITPAEATATPPATHPATAFVSATATFVTESFNGLASGTKLDLLSVVPQVSSAKLGSVVSGGALPESDDQYFARASAKLGRMTSTLVTANNFTQWAADSDDYPYIYRVTTLDNTDYTRTTAAGNVLLLVAPIDASKTNLLGGVGSPANVVSDPSWGQKDEIRVGASQVSHLDLTVNVADPMIVTVKVVTTVHPVSSVTGAVASTAINEDLQLLISPNAWDWEPTLRKNEVIGMLSRVQDDSLANIVDYVADVTLSVTDAYIPTGKPANTVASSSFSVSSLTVNTSAPHGLSNTDVQWVALKIDSTTWEVFQATYATTTSFVVQRAATASPSLWVLVATQDAVTGDLTINDPAPLLASGAHEVTAL